MPGAFRAQVPLSALKEAYQFQNARKTAACSAASRQALPLRGWHVMQTGIWNKNSIAGSDLALMELFTRYGLGYGTASRPYQPRVPRPGTSKYMTSEPVREFKALREELARRHAGLPAA
ncbi:hypothetical protein ACFQU7_25215 [Pseudoroseomonas wenyumeiae]